MAQDLRSRLSERRRATPHLGVWLALWLGLAACADDAPQPRAVDVATIATAELRDAILDECHGPLRGRMDRIAATITLPDGSQLRAFARLPDQLRVQSAAGLFLLRDGEVLALSPTNALPAAAAAATRIHAVRDLVDAAALGPLHRATQCTASSDGELRAVAAAGEPVPCRLRQGTLLPAQFTFGSRTITLDDYRRTPTTWLVAAATAPELGRCTIQFDLGAIDWAADFFTAPAELPATAASHRMPSPGSRGDSRPGTPAREGAAAVTWIVLPDPGDWAARAAAYAPLHAELLRQNQRVAGFPLLWRDDAGAWLAAPFRQRDAGPSFAPPAGWQLRTLAAGSWLVVFPPDGDYDARVATGARLLQDAMATTQAAPRGPIVAQPYFHLHEGPPTAAQLQAPVVRVSVAVQ